jgi:phosphoketolase
LGIAGSVLVDAAVLSNLKRYIPLAPRNGIDRFHLALDVLDRAPPLGASTVYVKQEIRKKLVEHKRFIAEYGTDMPEVKDWR